MHNISLTSLILSPYTLTAPSLGQNTLSRTIIHTRSAHTCIRNFHTYSFTHTHIQPISDSHQGRRMATVCPCQLPFPEAPRPSIPSGLQRSLRPPRCPFCACALLPPPGPPPPLCGFDGSLGGALACTDTPQCPGCARTRARDAAWGGLPGKGRLPIYQHGRGVVHPNFQRQMNQCQASQ